MMRDKVLKVVSQVLDVEQATLNDDSSPENVPSWDSLKHMNLVLALEEEFGVRFSDERIMQMLNLRAITESVSELLPK